MTVFLWVFAGVQVVVTCVIVIGIVRRQRRPKPPVRPSTVVKEVRENADSRPWIGWGWSETNGPSTPWYNEYGELRNDSRPIYPFRDGPWPSYAPRCECSYPARSLGSTRCVRCGGETDELPESYR